VAGLARSALHKAPNLVAALALARSFVVNGTRLGERIPVQPFLLDSDSIRLPTHFTFELLIDDTILETALASQPMR